MARKKEAPGPTGLFDGLPSGPMKASAEQMWQLAQEGARAVAPWDRLETIFDERVARALARMGVPTAAQVAALERRVGELTARLDAITTPAPAKKAPARRKA